MRHLLAVLLLALLPALAAPAQTPLVPLDAYVQAPDPSFAWDVGESGPGYQNLTMTSQTWQGIPWRHTVTLFQPRTPRHTDVAILLVTGGSFSQSPELLIGTTLANRLGMPIAILWDIPNQPLYDGLREDALIAHTFVRFLETGDPSWPLLFPMTKAAVRAMDALQAHVPSLERFIVTGASKRGWTTWLAGVADERVDAIMPLVYDNLNIPAQMRGQMEAWGRYSPMIGDYTKHDLQGQLTSDTGLALSAAVDPYTYRDRLDMPKLIVNGSNDAYWTVDALNNYRSDLLGETAHLYVPNSGHGLPDLERVLNAAAGFSRLVAQHRPLPAWFWQHGRDGDIALLRVLAPEARTMTLWQATSADRHYDKATWTSTPMLADPLLGWTARVPIPADGTLALFAEATFEVEGQPMPLSTTLQVHSR